MVVKGLVVACALACAVPAMADKGKFGVRLRALYMDVDSSTSPSVAGLDVEDRWIPEVDLSYWMTDNLALELVLTYPQKHDVNVGAVNLGSVKHLPPTLMLQYHFMPKQTFQPYVGVGLNYTKFSGVNLGGITMSSHSTGWALQAGFDYKMSNAMYLNFDVKKVKIDADLSIGSNLKIDPWLVGVGIGWRF